jgi:site-specific recombinase XerD
MTRPYAPERRSLRLHDWPQRDQELFAQATASGGLLDDGGRGAAWMPKTQESYAWVYGRWLTFLTLGLGRDLTDHPGERATRENLAAFIASLREQGIASRTLFDYLKGVYVVLWFMLPEQDWSWLRDEVNRLHRRIERLRSIEDVPETKLAFRAGCKAMDRASDAASFDPIVQAVAFRDGLLLAFQAMMGLRLGELHRMTATKQHLGFIDGKIVVKFTRSERKNKKRLEKPTPSPLVPYIHRYLDHHRLILLQGKEGDAFWINQYGDSLSYAGLNNRLVAMSKRHLKKPFRSHSFRHGLASALVDIAPEQAMAAAGLLGNGFATADAYYIHGTSKIASRVQNEIVADLRAGFRNEQAEATNKPRGRA